MTTMRQWSNETAALLTAGKLAVRLDAAGGIVPEQVDIDGVECEHPDRSDAEKWRSAQAAALVRARAEYDRRRNLKRG